MENYFSSLPDVMIRVVIKGFWEFSKKDFQEIWLLTVELKTIQTSACRCKTQSKKKQKSFCANCQTL